MAYLALSLTLIWVRKILGVFFKCMFFMCVSVTFSRSPLGHRLVESLLHEWHQSAFLGQHSHQLDYEWQVVVTATRILDTVPASRIGKRLTRKSTNVIH